MEQFAVTTGALCILIMVMGILSNTGTFPATEKIVRFVVILYIIAAVFKSVKGSQFEIEINNRPQYSFQSESSEVLKNELIYRTQSELEDIISERLTEKNVSYNSLSVHILEQNGVISVNEIYVQCSMEYENTVMKCIQDIISEETKVWIGE